jgi:hypothetical protein
MTNLRVSVSAGLPVGLVKTLHAVVSRRCTVHSTLQEPPIVEIKIDSGPGAALDYSTDSP